MTDPIKPFLSILTIPPHGLQRIIGQAKRLARTALGRTRGPEQVLESLSRGLAEIGMPFNIDPDAEHIAPRAHVLSGAETLRQCIDLKRRGDIQSLLAGPNITLTPFEEHNLYLSPEIDKIIMPSQWPADFFIALVPELANKIAVWPAGVQIQEPQPEARTLRDRPRCLLYLKRPGQDMLTHIRSVLSARNIDTDEIEYGSYDQDAYFSLLEKSDFAIFLSQTESQGLAIQEAWARNVATLVWNAKKWTYANAAGTYGHADNRISAPYQSAETGLFFDGNGDFESRLDDLIAGLKQGSFRPYAYAKERLSDKSSALRLMQILDTMI